MNEDEAGCFDYSAVRAGFKGVQLIQTAAIQAATVISILSEESQLSILLKKEYYKRSTLTFEHDIKLIKANL